MTEDNITPWFPKDTFPVRPGVYERETYNIGPAPRYAYWTGDNWRLLGRTPQEAYNFRKHLTLLRPDHSRWRGLLSPSD